MSEPHHCRSRCYAIANCALGHIPQLHPMWCQWSIHILYLLQTSSDLRYICHIHLLTIIAERLSARLLIVQCSQFAHIYICHTLIAWARFLWSRPQTPSHVVLVRTRILVDWKLPEIHDAILDTYFITTWIGKADKENRSPNVNMTVLPKYVHCFAETVHSSSKNANSQQGISHGLDIWSWRLFTTTPKLHAWMHKRYPENCNPSTTVVQFCHRYYRSVQVSKVESRTPQQPYVSCTSTVHFDLSWEVIVRGKVVPSSCPLLREQSPYVYSVECLLQLVKLVDGAMVCQGNSDPDFTELCKQRGGQHQQSWSCICIQWFRTSTNC